MLYGSFNILKQEGDGMYQIYASVSMCILIVAIVIVLINRKTGVLCHQLVIEKYISKMESFADRYWYLFLLIVFLVYLFTRLFWLQIIPSGIQADELGNAYDAINLANYGVDRYLTPFPVYLRNHGDGCSVLYAYTGAIIYKIAGFSVFNHRLVRVLWAIPAFFCSYLIAKDLFQSKAKGLIAPILVTILPTFMMQERMGTDGYLFLSLVTIAFWFYYKAITSEQYRYYILAGIFLGLTLYTYAISYMVLPVFLILSTLYLMWVKKFSLKKTIVLMIPLFIFATPLVLFQLVNMQVLPEFKFLFTELKRLPGYRGSEISIMNIKQNYLIIKRLLFGTNVLRYNAFPEYGALYLFSIPLLIYGCILSVLHTIKSFKNRYFDIRALILFFAVVSYLVAMIIVDPNINKTNEIYLSFMLFIAIAIEDIYKNSKTVTVVIVGIYMVAFLSFSSFFFRHYTDPQYTYLNFVDTEYGDAIAYLNKNYDVANRRIYLLTEYIGDRNWEELMVLTYGEVSPYERNHGEKVQGNYYMGLEDELKLEEDCLYILGNNWRHITDYLGGNGYLIDDTFRDYAILYRAPLD